MSNLFPMSVAEGLEQLLCMEALFGLLAVLTPVVIVYLLVAHAKRCQSQSDNQAEDSRFP
jgi:hypothetical protein